MGLLQYSGCYAHTRVESGSDDPDNVGHFGHLFDGLSESHPQTKLSGCDLDFFSKLGDCPNMAVQMNLRSTVYCYSCYMRFWHEDS